MFSYYSFFSFSYSHFWECRSSEGLLSHSQSQELGKIMILFSVHFSLFFKWWPYKIGTIYKPPQFFPRSAPGASSSSSAGSFWEIGYCSLFYRPYFWTVLMMTPQTRNNNPVKNKLKSRHLPKRYWRMNRQLRWLYSSKNSPASNQQKNFWTMTLKMPLFLSSSQTTRCAGFLSP